GGSLIDTEPEEAEQLLRRTKAFATELEDRTQAAGASFILGRLLVRAGRNQAAEDAIREASASYRQLILEQPSVAGYRQQLGEPLCALGYYLTTSSRHEEAVKAYREALDIYQKLCADYPAVPLYGQYLTNVQTSLGQLLE